MPTFEYACSHCGHVFEKLVSTRNQDLPQCPSFAVGAAMPLMATALAPTGAVIVIVAGNSLLFLALLGGLAARAGGAGVTVGAIRVMFWGAMAMTLTAGIGALVGTVV
jgi:putative FmdB family regulatory protein